jgi:16S rRNA (uracil1498-N3)-methyltransferase
MGKSRNGDGQPGQLRLPRLFVDADLGEGAQGELTQSQAHYLHAVMRQKAGSSVCLFNGRDGEWRAEIVEIGRKSANVECRERVRPQVGVPDIHYLFAPLKHARLDYMVQKATEMGASVLQPVITEFTNVSRVNEARMRSNAIEAAEQCNLLSVPQIKAPAKLAALLDAWPPQRRLIYCDESADAGSPLAAIDGLAPQPLALLIGPEGGFSGREREALRCQPFVTAISLGPRIMRADTAAVAGLAVLQSVLGDWQ